MTFAAFVLIAVHLFVLVFSYQNLQHKIRQGKVPSSANLVTMLVSFAFTAGYIWLQLNQPTVVAYLLGAELIMVLLAAIYFELNAWMLCRKYSSKLFTARERKVLCHAAINPQYTNGLLENLHNAHMDCVAVHQSVAMTQFQISQIERIQTEELPLSIACRLSQLRERLLQLNAAGSHCEQNLALLKGDAQLISQH